MYFHNQIYKKLFPYFLYIWLLQPNSSGVRENEKPQQSSLGTQAARVSVVPGTQHSTPACAETLGAREVQFVPLGVEEVFY